MVADEAKGIIDRRCGEHLLLQDVANALNVSRSYLQRAFEEQGTDFSRELHIARMHKAGRLLARQSRVGFVARECGYASPSHFCVAFSTVYGLTPRELRRAVKLNERLAWRAAWDSANPVAVGSREYYRRRRAWRADRVRFHGLVSKMEPTARKVLAGDF